MWQVSVRPVNSKDVSTVHNYATKREALTWYLRFTSDGTLLGQILENINGKLTDHTQSVEKFASGC